MTPSGSLWAESPRRKHKEAQYIYLVSKAKSNLIYDWQSVRQSVCLGVEHPFGTCYQILLPVGMLLSESCGLVSVGRLLWREDGSAICNVITQWSQSRRTRNHTLLYHLILPKPGGPGFHIYIPQEQGDPALGCLVSELQWRRGNGEWCYPMGKRHNTIYE
jgi:hypothetical protein